MSVETNGKTVIELWNALSARDWKTLESCLADDVHYEDVATDDPGARGPENVVKRLRIAFDHLSAHEHILHHIVCEGDLAMLDHTEVWTFKTGERATNHFATLHELRDGRIAKWSDFWDVGSFVSQFPKWFLEELAKRSAADFSDEA